MNQEKLLQKIEFLEQEIFELKKLKKSKKSILSMYFSKLNVFIGVLISAFITSAVLYAAQITFTDGTVISAADVNNNFNELYTKMNSLETIFSGVSRDENTIIFEGVNVQIVSGEGNTNSALNGRGNLIVGYNEERGSGDIRTGSHNIIVGRANNYTSYGGLVVGRWNTISSPYSSVSGGLDNTASGDYSSVSGGQGNTANVYCSSVSGGHNNTASGSYSSISGGVDNIASYPYSSISGGGDNTASGYYSSISGGYGNVASSNYSSVSGGAVNTASGPSASVSGGLSNIASGYCSSVSGGNEDSVTGDYDWRAGNIYFATE